MRGSLILSTLGIAKTCAATGISGDIGRDTNLEFRYCPPTKNVPEQVRQWVIPNT
jgi:hypothetical protein